MQCILSGKELDEVVFERKYLKYFRKEILLKFYQQKLASRGVHRKISVLKTCSKFTGDHPCRSVISRTLMCNFIEIALRHGYSPVNVLCIFRTPSPKNTSGRLLLCKELLLWTNQWMIVMKRDWTMLLEVCHNYYLLGLLQHAKRISN